MQEFLKISNFDKEISHAVFGIPGPIQHGRVEHLLDVPYWGSLDEKELEK